MCECACACLFERSKVTGAVDDCYLLFLTFLSYLYHAVLSITQSEYGTSKSWVLVLDLCHPVYSCWGRR